MSLFKLHSLFKAQKNPKSLSLSLPYFLTKTLTSTPQNPKKPLHDLFKEAVGLCEKPHTNQTETETETKNNLLELEREIRRLKQESKNKVNVTKITKNKPKKPESLHALFVKKNENENENEKKVGNSEEEEGEVFKELSPEMEEFVRHLYKEGYFNTANFLPGRKLDFSCFDNGYGRNFIKFAAEKFGKDHQEIAKWLSGSDLKKVALFGCPSLARKNVFSAKRLRTYFEIQENTVCSKCMLKDSCKFVNQSVWRGDTKNLNLAVVMRVITLYALEAVPAKLTVPDEIKASINRLLKDVINLSRTTA